MGNHLRVVTQNGQRIESPNTREVAEPVRTKRCAKTLVTRKTPCRIGWGSFGLDFRGHPLRSVFDNVLAEDCVVPSA